MQRWRRIALISLFVLSAFLIAFLLYFFFFRGITSPIGPGTPEGVGPSGALPTANVGVPGLPTANVGVPGAIIPGAVQGAPIASGGLTLSETLIPTVVSNPKIGSDGNVYYYDRESGQFLKFDPNTKTSTPLSNQTFFGVNNVSWAPKGETRAILEFPDQRKIFFDFAKQEQVTLPSHWKDFDWAQSGNEIIAKSIGIAQNNRYIITANPDGSNARPVAELGDNESLVDINYSPNNDIIAFSNTGGAQPFGEQRILPIGKNQENFAGITVQGLGFEGVWSPDGTRLLYSAANESSDWKPALWVVDGRAGTIGSSRKSIGLLTWADKCTFGSGTIAYCAAPRDLDRGASFARATTNETPDDIYKIDLTTGQYRLIATPDAEQAISQLMVSKDGGSLLYTELQSGALKKIRIR